MIKIMAATSNYTTKNYAEVGKFKYNIPKHFIKVRLFAPTPPQPLVEGFFLDFLFVKKNKPCLKIFKKISILPVKIKVHK